MVYELPMFPLGSVLVPTMVLPLHLFEPRYQRLAEHLNDPSNTDDHAGEFGVVLIERGSEVGGGETRTAVGTVARTLEAERFEDGRWAMISVGLRRCRIVEWLEDAPYPRALVEDWPDGDGDQAALPDDSLSASYQRVLTTLRQVLARAAELGDPTVAATIELSDDPSIGSHQATAVGPFGPSDQQRLLEIEGPMERLVTLHALLLDQLEMLVQRLELSDTDGP